jgi:hypothetical protein
MMSAQQARARNAMPGTPPSFNTAGNRSRLAMPFDHAATFNLKGTPGNIVQDVINISSDGAFVAVAIGYGFEEDRGRTVELINPPTDIFKPGSLLLSQIPIDALIEGFRINPRFERLVFNDQTPAAPFRERTLSAIDVAAAHSDKIIERLKPAEEISFLFSILDSATGRELQDEPTHNLASLGSSDGARPFRMLAQPLTFQPRSTIRLQIVERSENVRGTLFIVLYGYKTLGAGTLPRPVAQPAVNTSGPEGRVIPFDYVATFPLTGSPRNQIEAEVPINVEGGFVATSIGYGLAVESLDVSVSNPTDNGELGTLTLSQFPTSALQDGIRIRPNFLRVALNGSSLQTIDQPDLVNRMFERLNRPEDVSFRYSIFDSGTGRELQNQPINNIAGLGIANGDRPFKQLARPMLFLPRSTIRVIVEEQFGRGNLFIVFQGYKRLGGSGMNQAPIAGRNGTRR